MKNPQLITFSMVEDWRLPTKKEEEDTYICSKYFYLTLLRDSFPGHLIREKNPEQKRRRKSVFADEVILYIQNCKRSTKYTRMINKVFQMSFRITGLYTKINSIFVINKNYK